MQNLTAIKRQQIKDNKRYERYAYRVFYRALNEQIKPIIENDGKGQVSNQPMLDAYQKVYDYIGVDSASKEYKRIKKQEDGMKADPLFTLLLSTWSEWMRSYVIENLGYMITNVTLNTQNRINLALQDALEAGETRTQTMRRIFDYTLGEIGKRRARVIARTETTRATNEGKRKSAEDYGNLGGGIVMYKKWIHIPTPGFREFHLAEGKEPPIPVNELFVVSNPKGGTNDMTQPGDASAPGNQTINCNCTTIYMSERYARRNYDLDQ